MAVNPDWTTDPLEERALRKREPLSLEPKKKPGRKPKVGSEIHEECFVLHAERGWSFSKIAKHLQTTYGISNTAHPEKPVPYNTISTWVKKGAKIYTPTQKYQQMVELAMVGVELDDLKSLLYDLRLTGQVASLKETALFIETALKIRKFRSDTYGLYQPVDRRATAGVGAGEPELPGLDPATERMLATLQAQVEEQHHNYRR